MNDKEKLGRVFGIYSVKDELTGFFHEPVFIETDKEAQRWFKFVINNNRIWHSNASMYNFYLIGYFDEKNGIKEIKEPEMICGGLAVKEE